MHVPMHHANVCARKSFNRICVCLCWCLPLCVSINVCVVVIECAHAHLRFQSKFNAVRHMQRCFGLSGVFVWASVRKHVSTGNVHLLTSVCYGRRHLLAPFTASSTWNGSRGSAMLRHVFVKRSY
jgi:hypothetical protein